MRFHPLERWVENRVERARIGSITFVYVTNNGRLKDIIKRSPAAGRRMGFVPTPLHPGARVPGLKPGEPERAQILNMQ